ncbi:MAG: hypothetical protein ABIG96_05905 [Candidatus Micrarchaeota archaeon]
MAKNETFWGQIDPFLVSIVLILISAIYALPKVFMSVDYSLVQYGFYAAASFLILFDAYARGMLKFPEVLFKGPLSWPLVIITGLSMFVALWLAIPYLLYVILTDLLGMSLDFGSSTLFLAIVSFVAVIWYASTLMNALEFAKKGMKPSAPVAQKAGKRK